ncbi:MAG: hypothetical protein P8H97_07530 [Pseudomonadales bacterium]|nr:hypothetical protein [Pseudomonadales bacterium]MDG2079414.1 hypothetical protein [Pseudomonadales bacterium]
MKTIFQYAAVIALFSSSCAMAGSINERQSSQQDRIKQGIHSGELTPNEARILGRQQVKTHRKEARFKSDGTFSFKERAKIQRDLNQNSRKIHRQKHDEQQRS